MFGEGALHAFEYRMHDTRIGRFWSVDPLAGEVPVAQHVRVCGEQGCGRKRIEGIGLGSKTNRQLPQNEQIPIRVVNARDQLKVEPPVSPKTELRLQMSTKTIYAIDPGEIRPAPSEYERSWAESAGYFGTKPTANSQQLKSLVYV